MTAQRRALLLVGLTLLVAAVGYLTPSDWLADPLPDGPPPRIYLHRAGGALWPENTLTAVRNAVAWRDPAGRAAQGIEVDIELTRDHVPVLAHDPWLTPEHCRHADGRALDERVLIRDLTAAELRADYRCGVPGEHPALEPVATLDELITAVAPAPELAVLLDVKVDPPLTADAAAFAAAIMTRWRAAALRNPLALEAPDAPAIAAFRAAAHDHPVELLLSYPAFTAQNQWTLAALLRRARVRLLPGDAADAAADAAADGVMSLPEVLTWHAARRAREADKSVMLFFRDPRVDLDRYCAWPVSALLVDHPADARCPDAALDAHPIATTR